MLDKSLRLVFRNFSTLFLVAAVVFVPLHTIHSYVFRHAIEVRELHDDIESFPAGRQVRSVGRNELSDYRNTRLAVTVAGILLLPLLLGAMRRVMEIDNEGGVPMVTDAWAHALKRLPRLAGGARPGAGGAIGGGLMIAAAVLVISIIAARYLVDLAPGEASWVVLGLSSAAARSVAAAFFLIPLAVGLRGNDDGTAALPELY